MCIVFDKWIEIAEYDFASAKDMFKMGRYPYVAFMCHLAIEEILKAVIIFKTKFYPPRYNNLELLAKEAELAEELNEEQKDVLMEISFFYKKIKYPYDFINLKNALKKEDAAFVIKKTEELLKWIKQKIK